jgi:hypothetical protein
MWSCAPIHSVGLSHIHAYTHAHTHTHTHTHTQIQGRGKVGQNLTMTQRMRQQRGAKAAGAQQQAPANKVSFLCWEFAAGVWLLEDLQQKGSERGRVGKH